jgi:hypothetical protein
MYQSIWILTSPTYKMANTEDADHRDVIVGLFASKELAEEYRDTANAPVTDGTITEWSLDGVHLETYIDLALERLEALQIGELKCRENALTITKLEEAKHWLDHRTKDRTARGVLGTNER